MKKPQLLSKFLWMCVVLFSNNALARNLKISSMNSDPAPKKAFETVIAKFEKENPEIKVTLNTVDHESYKVQIRTWLPNNPPDIATWFAGNRAKYFIEKGLVEPIDDAWKAQEKKFSEGALKSISFNGKKYLAPISYYHWGFYYRKDLFEKAGIKNEPKTWQEFLNACKKLSSVGMTPITIGTKQSWPSAAWFDFLNMRINGFDFHMELLSGKHKYTNEKVKKTFEAWKELVELNAFPKNSAALTWQEASALLWQGKASMYLMGNFISSEIPKEIENQIGFFQFPIFDNSIPVSQVAPTDVIFIPAKAKNKEDAKKFISYFLSPEIQSMYNFEQNLIPPNTAAKFNEKNIFLTAGRNMLANAKGVSQFFDRDTEPEVAKAGMDGFVEFMSFPKNINAILEKIEKTRARVQK
jgi:multiple sugar transport system substrate-binding protein